MKTLELDMLGEDNPTKECYSTSEREAHQDILNYVLSHVNEATFESLTLLIGNYDFSFNIASTHEQSFLLKVRGGELMASHEFVLPECAVEAAMAAYRLLVALPRSLQRGEDPTLILIDDNGHTLNSPFPEYHEESPKTIHRSPTGFEGKFIKARIIPVVDGNFITEVFHHSNAAWLLADHQFADFELAEHFVNFYMKHADNPVAPQYPEALLERALAIILN